MQSGLSFIKNSADCNGERKEPDILIGSELKLE